MARTSITTTITRRINRQKKAAPKGKPPAATYHTTARPLPGTKGGTNWAPLAVGVGLAAVAGILLWPSISKAAEGGAGGQGGQGGQGGTGTPGTGGGSLPGGGVRIIAGTPSGQLQIGPATIVAPSGLKLRATPEYKKDDSNTIDRPSANPNLRERGQVQVLSQATPDGWVQVQVAKAGGGTEVGFVCNDCSQLETTGQGYRISQGLVQAAVG